MADRRLLAIGSGLAQGLEQGVSNLQHIMQSSYKLKQEKELLDLKKKAIENTSSLLPYQQDKLINETKASKARIGYYSALSKKAEQETSQNVDTYKLAIDEYNKNPLGYRVSIKGGKTNLSNINDQEKVITDAVGNPVGSRPKGSVFQPKATNEDMSFLGGGGAQPAAQPVVQPQSTGRIKVKIKGGTQTGTIDAGEFNADLYEKI